MGIYQLLNDPINYLRHILMLLPTVLPALILHECAHGFVAYKLGDPTAKMLGRLSLDPRRHLDPLGTLSMIFIGLGWAKPVPINPRNFKHPRRDDLLVSLAGIAMNFLLFLISYLALNLVYIYAWRAIRVDNSIADILYTMLYYFVSINLNLAVFNLIPIPPLDGYHVLNDLILKRPLFADRRAAQIGQGVMLVLLFSGALDTVLSAVTGWIMNGVSDVYYALFRLVGIV